MNPIQCDAQVLSSFVGEEGSIHNTVKTYSSIFNAVQNAPDTATGPYRIYINKGRYVEKIIIDKPFIHFVGEDIYTTILTYNLAQGSFNTETNEPWGNSCASLIILASHFSAQNMTIENSFDYNRNAQKDESDPSKIKDTQGLAIRTGLGSDKLFFKNVYFKGHQDTVFAQFGRQLYKNCIIEGHVDFIYGAAQAIFDSCTILVKMRNKLPVGFICAPSTQKTETYGFLFLNCTIKRKDPEIPEATVYLGRPWHPTITNKDGLREADPDAVGAAVFMFCQIDDCIHPDGFTKMHGRTTKGEQVYFYPDKDARFYEYKNTGPGAKINEHRKQLTQDESVLYTALSILGDWNPLV